jgi:hypothetical protein
MTKEGGYGWSSDLSAGAWDSGETATIILPDGTTSSPRETRRLKKEGQDHSPNDFD